MAEGSLAWRRRKVAELEEAVKRVRDIGDAGEHLAYANCIYIAEEGANAERESIEKADLFGHDLSEEVYNFGADASEVNPFAAYLRKLADKLEDPSAVALERNLPGFGDFPDYEVCRSDLDAITGESPRARRALKSGRVQLSDIPDEFMTEDATIERMKWLESKTPPELIDSALEQIEWGTTDKLDNKLKDRLKYLAGKPDNDDEDVPGTVEQVITAALTVVGGDVGTEPKAEDDRGASRPHDDPANGPCEGDDT